MADTVEMTAVLTLPPDLVPRVVAALRGEYPDLTRNVADDAVLGAFARGVVAMTVVQWEMHQAEADLPGDVEKIRQDYEAKAATAQQKATSDVAKIKDKKPGQTALRKD